LYASHLLSGRPCPVRSGAISRPRFRAGGFLSLFIWATLGPGSPYSFKNPMNRERLADLQKLRNQIAHSAATFDDPAVLAKRLYALGLSIPPAELAELVPDILKALGRHAGVFFVPRLLTQVVTKILEDVSAAAVCDPCAGVGELLATVWATTKATKA